MLEKLFVLIITCIAIASCNSKLQQDTKYSHYEMFLKVDPAENYIEVKGKLIIPQENFRHNDMSFYLDSSLIIEEFSCQDIEFKKDSSAIKIGFMPNAINMVPSKPLSVEKKLNELTFTYKGNLSGLPKYFGNVISEDWIELGLYYPWFPYNSNINLYTYKVAVEIEKGYHVFGIGKITKDGNNYIIDNEFPTNDIVICASNDMKLSQNTKDNFSLSIYHHNLSDSVLSKLHEDIGFLYKRLSNLYGETKNEITIIMSKREKGGGYARIGGIFLGGFQSENYFDEDEEYYRYFAHELAHLWWYRADVNSWEDWINEGIAEYSALAIVRDVFGEEVFQVRLSKKEESSNNSGPLWELDRKNNSAYSLLYNKAPVILFRLEEKIGKERLNMFLNEVLANKNISTQKFLCTLEEHEGKKLSDWFENELKTR